jgi:hypothetical protein
MKQFAERNGFELTIENDKEPAKRPTKSRITKEMLDEQQKKDQARMW